MPLRHPHAVRDASPPSSVTVDGTDYPIAVDGAVDCPDAVADRLVDAWRRRYGVERDDLVYEEDGPPDTCDVEMSNGDICGRDRPCQYHDSGVD